MRVFKFYRFSFFLVCGILGLGLVSLGGRRILCGRGFMVAGEYFFVDSASFYLVLLVILLGLYRQFLFYSDLNLRSRTFLIARLFSRLFCFCVNHSIFFWCFYELSMLPLLYLIFRESPYSERFLAAWYFACYLLITSLPLVLILVYLSVVKNSFFFRHWRRLGGVGNVWLLVVLTFIFFTKVPLTPFHTWLPIVHAEASSIVSIFLSGYIMKLGLLGVYRCSAFLFKKIFIAYFCVCAVMCIRFFVVAANELDGKRWLAFLRLAHIVVPFMCFFICNWEVMKFCFFYCLGHGLRAGLVFGLLWYFYDLSNSRKWLLLKSSVRSSRRIFIIVFSLLRLCSFPPTVQFICEVLLIGLSGGLATYLLFWGLYLFLGGLVPLVLCGSLLIRREWIEDVKNGGFNYLNFLFLLCLWCYIGFMVI